MQWISKVYLAQWADNSKLILFKFCYNSLIVCWFVWWMMMPCLSACYSSSLRHLLVIVRTLKQETKNMCALDFVHTFVFWSFYSNLRIWQLLWYPFLRKKSFCAIVQSITITKIKPVYWNITVTMHHCMWIHHPSWLSIGRYAKYVTNIWPWHATVLLASRSLGLIRG